MKEKFFELSKLSLIQRNFFFDRISKKCFSDAKKLFSQCRIFTLTVNFTRKVSRNEDEIIVIESVVLFYIN